MLINNPFFEKFLGQNLTEIEYFDSIKETMHDNIFVIEKPTSNFFGKEINRMAVTRSDKNVVSQISFFIDHLVNKTFLQNLSANYGKRDETLFVDKITEEPETEIQGIILRESFITTKKENLNNDEPLLIRWNKENYQIEVFFNRFDGVTKVTFKTIKN